MKSLLKDTRGDANALIGMASSIVAIVVIVVLFTITPLVGSEVNESINIPAGTGWNATENTNLDESSTIWESASGLIQAAVTVAIAMMIVGVIFLYLPVIR